MIIKPKILPIEQAAASKITPKTAMNILNRNGLAVNEYQAAEILSFLRIMAKMSLTKKAGKHV